MDHSTDVFAEFHGPNAGFLYELYERFLQDPGAVDAETRAFFERSRSDIAGDIPVVDRAAPTGSAPTDALLETQLSYSEEHTPISDQAQSGQVAAVVNLASALRSYGHMSANLDPLGSPPPGDPWLDLAFHGINELNLHAIPAKVISGMHTYPSAWEAIRELFAVYAARSGHEYSHIRIPEERDWLRDAAESRRYRPPGTSEESMGLLHRLTEVEGFEQFLQRIYPGKTRFSIEGLDMLVPMLDELLDLAVEAKICTAIIGMAHRGRLNVLAHVLGKPYDQILAEFKDPVADFSTREALGWMGDVKYHKGALREINTDGDEVRLVAYMPPNPSHLEHINPVVVGMARAAGSKVDRPGAPQFFTDASLPVLIHGDAAFPGQGIVAETINFSRLAGYSTGGSIHLIANNQLGYTTDPKASRSTFYASDLAKGYQIPILHVNADDPIACLEAIRIAFAYRQTFKKDFLIDLIGYRRYGHNEGDEPAFTQPRLYAQIEQHPNVRQQWAEMMIEQGFSTAEQTAQLTTDYLARLQEIHAALPEAPDYLAPQLQPPERGLARRVNTAVDVTRLAELNTALLTLPLGFEVHRKLARSRQRRQASFEEIDQPGIDWSAAEELAIATLLSEGTAVRLTGEDVGRGTFSQRHAVLHHPETGETLVPLQALPQARASFEVINSALSENAAIGFEFGYNLQAPDRLVIWEAQYGDFINTAQAVIDEFIISARVKWEQTPSLVLLLPHAHEGQGPDHSSGRPERFLQMAAGLNLRLANCTTAAQYFHLLRRQAALLKSDPLPLIVLTPKSLLRHPEVASSPRQLAEGAWQPLLSDPNGVPGQVTRLVFCSGKMALDLDAHEQRSQRQDLAVARVEQLYPYPLEEMRAEIVRYPNLEEVLWVQEEPENMGAWAFYRPVLEELLQGRLPLAGITRPASSAPAEGSTAWHHRNQKAILEAVFSRENVRAQEVLQ